MRWMIAMSKTCVGALLLVVLAASPALAQDPKPFTKEQLDQMTAQVALYPDALLSQLFMATTYPDEFAEATRWAKANPDAKGDEAVKSVESQNWDPSVASMVAFPEVLITLGEKTDWVKNMGDAFLAQPEDVMDSVQRLRVQAQKAGNLKSSEQVKVSTQAAAPPPQQAAAPAAAAAPAPQVIVIEQTQPQVVYVPMYNPTTVYGPWLWPSYPPYYYPYPPGYWWSRPIATGIAWGVGIGVSNALWGGFNWGRGDVDINVNRYNNINVNNKLDIKGGDKTWNHNPEHRKTSYRGGDATRQNLDKKFQSGNREQFRGHDANRDASRDGSRDASRERANQAMANRGVEAPKGSAADRAKSMERDGARDRPGGGGGQLDGARDRAGGGGAGDYDGNRDKLQSADRSMAKQNAQASTRDNALRGANSNQARQQADRGSMSHASAKSSGGANRSSMSGGGGGSRPSAGGGGGARPSAGGGGGGGGRKR